MKCEKFEELWNECLDRRVSPQTNEQLTAHAAPCPKCAELLAGGELLQWAFPGMPQVAPSAGFSSRVLDAWNQSAVLESASAIPSISLATQLPSPQQSNARIHTIPVATEVKQKKGNLLKWATGIAVSTALVVVLSQQSTNQPNADTNNAVVVSPKAGSLSHPKTLAVVQSPKVAMYDMATVFQRENISHVGYTVADGITPVTKSVSAALQSLKRPLLKNTEETPPPAGSGRSSWVENCDLVNV